MPHRNRVLVVDDRIEDGESIVRRLWKCQVPSFFFHYDPVNLEELDQLKRMEGIRIVFQDIAIVSSNFPGHQDYSAAATAIEKILSPENGPWLMVAWSTWAEDPDKGSNYAKQLFEYLCSNLQKGQRPYDYIVINKSPYTSDGFHGEVLEEDQLDTPTKQQLLDEVGQALKLSKSVESLYQWESDIRNSAARVFNTLWDMTKGDDVSNRNASLAGVLFQLAKAQEGSRIEKNDDISEPLYQILSSILYDKLCHMDSDQIVLGEHTKENVEHASLNTILHWESEGSRRSPGSVYLWPDKGKVDIGHLQIKPENLKEFILASFVQNNVDKQSAAQKDALLLNNTSLMIMDITPACDHANDKAIWRRFMVGLMVKSDAEKHFCKKGKPSAGDFVKATPEFLINNQKVRFLFNSKLIFSINEWNPVSKVALSDSSDDRNTTDKFSLNDLELLGRLREQILQEIVSWYGSMATRPGIVSIE